MESDYKKNKIHNYVSSCTIIMFTIGSLYDLLCSEPDLYVSGEILRHRLPAEVEVCVHGVPGQEGGRPRLDLGGPAGSPQELDTGRLLRFRRDDNIYYSTDTSTNWK